MLDSYQFTSAFNWPIGSLSTTTKLYEKEDAEKTWYWDPFAANLSWKLPYRLFHEPNLCLRHRGGYVLQAHLLGVMVEPFRELRDDAERAVSA
jgi:hypothetical protein